RCRAATSRPTSVLSAASRWKAMRWALLGPTPGSRPSSSMRSWTAPSYTVIPSQKVAGSGAGGGLEARQSQATAAAETAGQRAHRLRGELVGGALGVADGGDDEVLQGLDVVRVDGSGRDGERGELT